MVYVYCSYINLIEFTKSYASSRLLHSFSFSLAKIVFTRIVVSYTMIVRVTCHVIGSQLLCTVHRITLENYTVGRRSLWWPTIIDYIGQLHIARMPHTHARARIRTQTFRLQNIMCIAKRQIEFRVLKKWKIELPSCI